MNTENKKNYQHWGFLFTNVLEHVQHPPD